MFTKPTRRKEKENTKMKDKNKIKKPKKDKRVDWSSEISILNVNGLALGSVAQLVEASSRSQKGCRFNSWSGHIIGARIIPSLGACNPLSRHLQKATCWCFSFALMFLSLPSSLSKSNEKKMSSGEDKKCKWFKYTN